MIWTHGILHNLLTEISLELFILLFCVTDCHHYGVLIKHFNDRVNFTEMAKYFVTLSV